MVDGPEINNRYHLNRPLGLGPRAWRNVIWVGRSVACDSASRLPFRTLNNGTFPGYEAANSIFNTTAVLNIKIEKSSNAYSYKPPNMPLVVPGLMSSAGSNNEQESWMNKLVGKKLTDSTSDTTVRLYVLQ